MAAANVFRRDRGDGSGDWRCDVYPDESTRTARPGRGMLLCVWECIGVAAQHLAGSCCQRGLDQPHRGRQGTVADHLCVCVHGNGCSGMHISIHHT